MLRPLALNPAPSIFVTTLGGVTGMLILSAILYLAPVIGLPFIDVPRIVGGLFIGTPTAAFWIGYLLFFLGGALIAAPLLGFAWTNLPGSATGLGGAFVKGLLLGLAVWAATGIGLPLLAWLGTDRTAGPGLFGFGAGPGGAIVLLVGCAAFGVAVGLTASLERGLSAPDGIGWESLTHMATGPRDFGEHRSEEL